MSERFSRYVFHEVTEFDDDDDYFDVDQDEGNYQYCNAVLIFTFVVYEPINEKTHIAYGLYKEKSEIHEVLHQLAQEHDDGFWDKLPDDKNEPIGGGVINLKNGNSRGSNNFGLPSPEVMRAVHKFINKHEGIMCDLYFD